MPLYRVPNSPFWIMRLPRPGQRRPLCESTKILHSPSTTTQAKENRALAERAMNARMGDLARERYDLPPAAAEPDPEKMGAWLTWYETHVVSTHRGAERERETLKRLRAEFGTLPLPEITRARVAEWMTARAKTVTPSTGRPVSASTINREVDILKAVLRSAAQHGKLEASPIAGMTRLHTITPTRRILTRDEEARLLAAIRQPEDRALFLMGLDTLCRLGDCLDLRRDDDHGTTLWIRDPKAGGGYAVPVSSRLRTALDACPTDGHEYYFTRRRLGDANKSRNSVRQMLEHACARTDPPIPFSRAAGGITWHWATRRTAATRMLQAGVDMATVQRAGHWASPSVVLGIYAGVDDARLREAVEGIGGHHPDNSQDKAPQK